MNDQVIHTVDLIYILCMGVAKAQDLAIEFDANKGYILMPIYRLN
jgi:hypothetical protein